MRLLIVEDDLLIAMELEYQIEDMGHVVSGVARTADEAVRLAETTRPDAVLMDLRLADGSSGADAARRIRDGLSVRSIFVSGNLDPVTRARLAELEPVAMLSKPIMPAQLRRALAEVARPLN